MKLTTMLSTTMLACSLLAPPASAQFIPQATAIPGSAPEGINYQGRLEDGGFPVNATKAMIFRVYSAPVGGVLLWTSPAQAVPVALGLFSAVVPVPTTVLVGGGARYLEVSIDGTLMSPRELLNSVPYALIAKSVEGSIDVSTAGLSINANSTAPQPALYISSVTGNVGIGTGAPITAFDVGGSAQFGSGTTKSTFSATGALNTAGKITAPDYTATYGISAASAAITYVQASSIAVTGNANVHGTLRLGLGATVGKITTTANDLELAPAGGVSRFYDGATNEIVQVYNAGVIGIQMAGNGLVFFNTGGNFGVGTAAPATKLHMSSGTLTIDGNTATALTTVGSVGIGTGTLPSSTRLSVVGGQFHLAPIADNVLGSVLYHDFYNSGNPIARFATSQTGASSPSGFLMPSVGGVNGLGYGINSHFSTASGVWAAAQNAASSSWAAGFSGGDCGTNGCSFGQGDRYDILRGAPTAGVPVMRPYLSITSNGAAGPDGVTVRIPGGVNANAAASGNDMFNVGASSFVVQYAGNVGVGTATPGTKLDVIGGITASSGSIKQTFKIGLNGGSEISTGQGFEYRNFAGTHVNWDLSAGAFFFDRIAGTQGGFDFSWSGTNFEMGTADGGTTLSLKTAGTRAAFIDGAQNIGVGTSLPASKLHMSSGTLTIDGNTATALTTVGNVGIGTSGSTPADRLEVAGGNVRLTAVAGVNGSVKLFSTLTVGAVTCTAQCGANTMCLAAWDSAGTISTCGTAAADNRCLCSGFGN